MKKNRRFITLIEIMIVMFLIALISGVVAYNYRGSLEEGKAFKTKTGIEKLETILNMAVAEEPDLLDDIDSGWQNIVETSPLVKSKNALIKDGWGNVYQVSIGDNGIIEVESERLNEYQRTHATLFK